MSLPKFYSKQFREEMLCHPVWLPGEGATPGDIGVMRDGVFTREGSFSDYTEVKAKIAAEGAEPVPGTPEDYARDIASEWAKWSKVVQDAGIKAN